MTEGYTYKCREYPFVRSNRPLPMLCGKDRYASGNINRMRRRRLASTQIFAKDLPGIPTIPTCTSSCVKLVIVVLCVRRVVPQFILQKKYARCPGGKQFGRDRVHDTARTPLGFRILNGAFSIHKDV